MIELEALGGGDELPGARDGEEDPDVVPVPPNTARSNAPDSGDAARLVGGCLPPLPVSGTTRRVQYEWDEGKAAKNLRKHGVDFMDAIAALEDPNRLEEVDARFAYDEERIQAREGSREGALRGRDVLRRAHVQDHIGLKGHET